MTREQIKTEYIYDLETLRKKCQNVIDEGHKDEKANFSLEWFTLFEIVGYCNGAIKRVKDLY